MPKIAKGNLKNLGISAIRFFSESRDHASYSLYVCKNFLCREKVFLSLNKTLLNGCVETFIKTMTLP